jgi:hypothetical protein
VAIVPRGNPEAAGLPVKLSVLRLAIGLAPTVFAVLYRWSSRLNRIVTRPPWKVRLEMCGFLVLDSKTYSVGTNKLTLGCD